MAATAAAVSSPAAVFAIAADCEPSSTGPHAPHYSADAPPYAQTLFSDLVAPLTPAFNVSTPKGEKTLHVTQYPPLNALAHAGIDRHFRDRWRSIHGVDTMLGLLHAELKVPGHTRWLMLLFAEH
eukprot:SAG11_NODE_11077_length_785_cov_1.097668_2_plen_125_part_00